jgi:hypothetical protein
LPQARKEQALVTLELALMAYLPLELLQLPLINPLLVSAHCARNFPAPALCGTCATAGSGMS